MSDIRFKISGNTSPFIAQLYQNNSIVSQKAVEYSGSSYNSCGIFYGLYPSTAYVLKIVDNIGNITCTGFTTPLQIGTTTQLL